MANNLRVFNTNSEYQSADLVHPSVSYVVETDVVKYDMTAPPFQGKWKATYSGGETYELACDGNTTLTDSSTKPSGYDYTKMTSAEIGDCVTIINSNALYRCTSLTSCTIGSGVTNIYKRAFANCTSLTSVTIGSGVTSIGSQAFKDCRSLTSITVNAITPPTFDSSAFTNTNNCPIYVPSQSVNAYKSARGWSSYASRIQAIP